MMCRFILRFGCVIWTLCCTAARATVERTGAEPQPEALYAAAEEHVAAKRYNEAAVELERAVVADPSSWQAWALLSLCRIQARRFDDALDACDRALALKPGEPGALLRHAICLKELHRYDEAIAAYRGLLDTGPGRHVVIECHWGLAECAQANGDADAVKAHVREVTRRDGRRGRLLDATLRLRRGDVQGARRRFERLFRADDEHPLIVYGLAACLLRLNREHEFALRLLEQAAGAPELDPADVLLAQVQALVRLARFDEARAVLGKLDAETALTAEQQKLYDDTNATITNVLGK